MEDESNAPASDDPNRPEIALPCHRPNANQKTIDDEVRHKMCPKVVPSFDLTDRRRPSSINVLHRNSPSTGVDLLRYAEETSLQTIKH